jgi:pimeloyl-ACP methyl ester carboxylesterase
MGDWRVPTCDQSGHAVEVRAVFPAIRTPTLVLQHADDVFIPPVMGKNVADDIDGAKYQRTTDTPP